MSDEPNPNPNEKNPLITLLWLAVGLAPVFILLSITSSPGPRPSLGLVLIVCAICNLLGGIGCLRSIKDVGKRVGLGILLAGFFFALSWGIVLFQACSHMNI
jgi:hypothetical protein